MKTLHCNAHSNRSRQIKCTSVLSCLIFGLLISSASCEETKKDEVATLNDSDYMDPDDIEWGNFPIVESTTKGHPVVFYKEDIVSEDYDPTKETKSALSSKEQKSQFRRRYKDINRRNRLNRTENYRYIKPDKVYFDVYPTEHEQTSDEDFKLNDDNIQVEVISLLDDPTKDELDETVHLKQKRPKKVSRHHRQRRGLGYRRKNAYQFYLPRYYTVHKSHYINVPTGNINVRRTTPKPIPDLINRIGDEIDYNTNWGIWERRPIVTTTRRPEKKRRPLPDIIHSADEDYRKSGAAPAATTYRPITTARPRPTISGVRTTLRPNIRTTTQPPPPPVTQESQQALQNKWEDLKKNLNSAPPDIDVCVWATTRCCKTKTEIQYPCFEYLGCIGDFWDINPCQEIFYRGAIEAVNKYFTSR